MNKRPPKFPLRFFRWFCHPDYVEDIEGDLWERFEKRPSRWRFAIDVLKLFRPGIIKSVDGVQKLNYYGMLKHNLLITFRGFFRHKTTFGINLIGLAASLTCILLSMLWIDDELKKDRFHSDSENLFQIYSRFNNSNGISVWQGVTGLLKEEIDESLPQVSISTVSTDVHDYTLSVENQRFKVHGRFGDEDYLKIFNYPLLKGQKEALGSPSNILITASLANRLFGRADVIGESVKWHFWSHEKTFQVAGILEDLTSVTSEQFDFILPWAFYHDELINYKGWGNYYGRVVVKVDNLSQKAQVEEKINEIFQSNHSSEEVSLFLTNYSDQYLYGNYENGKQAGGRIDYVYLAIIVAGLILLIACINFINLSTANASLKLKEIGVKKTFGARKSELALQFFLESILLSTLATLIASILTFILLEPFNQLAGKQLVFSLNFRYIGIILSSILSIGLIAGLYPAVYLSSLDAIKALKNKAYLLKSGHTWRRQALVFVQFTLSIILIVSTLIVTKQMDYALNKNLGYDRDNVLYFLKEGEIAETNPSFISELESIPGVGLVSESGFSIGPNMQNRTGGVDWKGKTEDQQIQFWENNGDAKSVDVLGLEVIAGRSFSKDLNEENSIIFNETAIQAMGLEDPIGQTVDHYTGSKKIIGIVKDFTTESLHKSMEPAMFLYRPERAHYIMAKIQHGKELETIERIESRYKKFNSNYSFTARFLDQDYQAMYDAEMRVAKLSKLFSGLAILISCLGLFGLTIFNVKRKTKEIGIRKVLGCESWKIALSMTFEVTKSVFLSLVIALPISYFVGQRWLENFVETVEVGWWIFSLAALIAIAIAWITVGSQTLKAANANPVESLRDE